MPPLTRSLYSGPVVHSLSLSQLEIIDSALFCVSVEGIIEWIERDVPGSFLQAAAAEHGVILREGEGVEVVKLGPGEFFCPGLVDTHTVRSLK